MRLSVFCFFFTLSFSNFLFVGDAFSDAHAFDYAFRLRYSDLKDGAGEDAITGKARSGLLRVNLESTWTQAFTTMIELDHVETGFDDEHSDGVRFNGRPEITDVQGTDLNQLYAELDVEDWRWRLGRQKVVFDQQRFVGSVSFWQNEQTFDAVFAEKDILSSSHAYYVYIANVNRIFGDDANARLNPNDLNYVSENGLRPLANLGDHEHNTHLIRIELNDWDYSQFVAYGYFIDNESAPLTSSDVLGARYRLKIKPNQFQYRAELEAAIQKRTELDAEPLLPYFAADVGIAYRSVELSARWEELGAKDNVAFFVPSATLHDFHGWADVFNIPPGSGLIDQSLQVKWRKAPFQVDLRYHRLQAEESGGLIEPEFGDELDFDIIYKPWKKHSVVLRFAEFRAKSDVNVFDDVRRVFVQYEYNL